MDVLKTMDYLLKNNMVSVKLKIYLLSDYCLQSIVLDVVEKYGDKYGTESVNKELDTLQTEKIGAQRTMML